MNTEPKIKSNSSYLQLNLALLLAFWTISTFEIVSKMANGIKIPNFAEVLSFKLLNDLWTSLIIFCVCYPLFFIFSLLSKKWANLFIKCIFCLVVLAQFALTKYHLTTLVYLGADILGYSFSDMFTTVTASESLSIFYFIPFVLFPVLFFFIHKKISIITINKTFIVAAVCIIALTLGLKFFNSTFSDTTNQNRLAFFTSDIIRYQSEKNEFDINNLTYKKEYPLVQPFSSSPDVLAPFFQINEEKPNIVMIIVEGLGDEFIGKNDYSGFTPYLDSLIPKSLYWENFVSNAGRTFGALPSILGSLPYGEKGFLELNPLPANISLVSILKVNDYSTSFYCGDDSSFDRKINFLEYNGIDNVIDINKFGSGYEKTKANSGGFSWGYPDSEIFRKTLSELDGKKTPRLDIIMTLTNHEPFDFPQKKEYLKKVDSILNTNKNLKVAKEEVNTYKDIFASLLYTDNSIKTFINSYSKRPEVKNTIFVITGDHRLIPIAQKDKLCRFHVPLYIYSPLLKRPQTFKSVSSHWDITPS
ncbi:LTA synthase family protein, partial [Flavobacterium sp.]|uniref:LTA synthase family protein n=1 Tax=Flavobacterium sp. TaxID=239 RepID=UPI002611CF6B